MVNTIKKIRDEVYDDFNTDFASKTTDDLTQGSTNLYSFFTRTGVTIKPKTAGDSLDLDGGDLLVGSGTAKIDNLSANKQAYITIADNINFANNLKAQFGTSQQFQIYFDGTNAQFITSTSSQKFYFTKGNITPHTPALGLPIFVLTDEYNGVSGLSFSNISTGTGADTRFMIKDTGGHYFVFGQPSLTNTATLFGLNRSEIDTIFNAGGTSRDIVIGTLGSKSVYLASNGTLRFEVDSGGDIHNNADNKRLYRGAGNDAYDQYNGTDWEFKANAIGSGAMKILSDFYFSGSGTGLPYGSMYADDISETVTVSASGTYYDVSGGNFTAGQNNLTSLDSNYRIQVQKAGVYEIHWGMDLETAAAGQYVEGTVCVNGTASPQAVGTTELPTANKKGHVSGHAILSLSANDYVGLCVSNETSTQDIIVSHGNLTITQIGG